MTFRTVIKHWIVTSVAAFILLTSAARASAADDSAFAIRGIKGLWWDGIEKYQLALPWLAKHDLNFLMTCYSSFPASGKDWRAEFSADEIKGTKQLAVDAEKLHVTLCVSFNPGIWSKPPLVYSSDSDHQIALHKVQMLHAIGIRWFGLCLDDISRKLEPDDVKRFGTLQAAQVDFVNHLWRDMKKLDPAMKLIFCPSAYTTHDAEKHLDYINTIGEKIDPEVMMFWTGPTVCSASITAEDADKIATMIHRKPFIWDNYPVNDMFPWRPLLAPLKNRSSDLPGATAGYMINPMKQWHATKIPLFTIAKYAANPISYNPDRAMAEAITEYPGDQQPAIKMLVELYGQKFLGEPGYPPTPNATDAASAQQQIARCSATAKLLSNTRGLEELWKDIQPTLDDDIARLKRIARDRRKESPLSAHGDDFDGGGGARFGYRKFDRDVNYVYAHSSKLDQMQVKFYLDQRPASDAVLCIVGRNDDSQTKPKIRITFNDQVVSDGDSSFSRDEFTEKKFSIPAAALKEGENVLTIRNLAATGAVGMPPWFMVAEAEVSLEKK